MLMEPLLRISSLFERNHRQAGSMVAIISQEAFGAGQGMLKSGSFIEKKLKRV